MRQCEGIWCGRGQVELLTLRDKVRIITLMGGKDKVATRMSFLTESYTYASD